MINIKVDTSRVTRNLDGWINDLEKMVANGVANAALAIEAEAKRNVPSNTGNLRRSIQTKTEGMSAVVSSNLEYAPYLENGTGIYSPDGRKDVPWTYYDLATGNFYKTSGVPAAHYLQNAVNVVAPMLGEYIKQELMK
ncbi:MAG: HK97 gp10 family phage protein [Paludibacteraceae bacterium]|nr:HK97 gp10 family phage protein [Paludibacteraceae bacterium]